MIQVKDIHIAFEDQVVFDKFSLDINKGDKVLLSAPSGKGKSTLMKSLLGFQRISSGKIFIDQDQMTRETIHQIRNKIAYVSQDVELGQRTCKDLLDDIFNFKSNKHLDVSDESYRSLGEELELPRDFLVKKVNRLSGGERQRLGFLICLLLKRPIWLLDEVTSGLDKSLKEKIVNMVMTGDETVIITSHDDIWLRQDAIKVVKW